MIIISKVFFLSLALSTFLVGCGKSVDRKQNPELSKSKNKDDNNTQSNFNDLKPGRNARPKQVIVYVSNPIGSTEKSNPSQIGTETDSNSLPRQLLFDANEPKEKTTFEDVWVNTASGEISMKNKENKWEVKGILDLFKGIEVKMLNTKNELAAVTSPKRNILYFVNDELKGYIFKNEFELALDLSRLLHNRVYHEQGEPLDQLGLNGDMWINKADASAPVYYINNNQKWLKLNFETVKEIQVECPLKHDENNDHNKHNANHVHKNRDSKEPIIEGDILIEGPSIFIRTGASWIPMNIGEIRIEKSLSLEEVMQIKSSEYPATLYLPKNTKQGFILLNGVITQVFNYESEDHKNSNEQFNKVIKGNIDPDQSVTSTDGDIYINTAQSTYYLKTQSQWSPLCQDNKVNGVWCGINQPKNEIGSNGDFYHQNGQGVETAMYIKNNNSWEKIYPRKQLVSQVAPSGLSDATAEADILYYEINPVAKMIVLKTLFQQKLVQVGTIDIPNNDPEVIVDFDKKPKLHLGHDETPAKDLGNNGDVYRQLNSYNLYLKENNKWQRFCGVESSAYQCGSNRPEASGQESDVYIQLTSGLIKEIYIYHSSKWIPIKELANQLSNENAKNTLIIQEKETIILRLNSEKEEILKSQKLAESKVQELNQKLDDLKGRHQSEISNLRSEINEKNQQISQHLATIRRLENELVQRPNGSEIASLRQEISELKSRIQSLENEKQRLLAELNQEKQNHERTKTELNEKITIKEKEVNTLTQKLSDEQKTSLELINQLKSTIAQKDNEIQTLQNQIEPLRSELARVQGDVNRLQAENNSQAQTIAKLSSELQAANLQIGQLQARILTLETENRNLAETNGRLSDDKKKLEKEKEELKNEQKNSKKITSIEIPAHYDEAYDSRIESLELPLLTDNGKIQNAISADDSNETNRLKGKNYLGINVDTQLLIPFNMKKTLARYQIASGKIKSIKLKLKFNKNFINDHEYSEFICMIKSNTRKMCSGTFFTANNYRPEVNSNFFNHHNIKRNEFFRDELQAMIPGKQTGYSNAKYFDLSELFSLNEIDQDLNSYVFGSDYLNFVIGDDIKLEETPVLYIEFVETK